MGADEDADGGGEVGAGRGGVRRTAIKVCDERTGQLKLGWANEDGEAERERLGCVSSQSVVKVVEGTKRGSRVEPIYRSSIILVQASQGCISCGFVLGTVVVDSSWRLVLGGVVVLWWMFVPVTYRCTGSSTWQPAAKDALYEGH